MAPERPRPPAQPWLQPACMEPLIEDLYPDGCSAQAQHCAKQRGHDGPHKAWVSMAPVIVEWAADFGREAADQ